MSSRTTTPPKRRFFSSSIKLLLLGMLIGAGLGGYLSLQRYLATVIIEALQEEVVIACPDCSLSVDSLVVNILRHRGVARNVRLSKAGVVQLTIPVLRTDFGLNRILEREVELTHLILEDAKASAFAPGSGIFQFIEYLTSSTPSPSPPLIKVKLQQLDLTPALLQHDFGTTTIEMSGTTVRVERNARDFFTITPRAASVQMHLKESQRTFEFGALDARLESGFTAMEVAHATFTGTAPLTCHYSGAVTNDQPGTLSGLLSAGLNTQFLGLEPLLTAQAGGALQVSGDLGRVQLSGATTTGDAGLTVAFADTELKIRGLTADLEADTNFDDYSIRLRNFRNPDPLIRVSQDSNLLVTGQSLKGRLGVAVEVFSIGPITAQKPVIDIELNNEKMPFTVSSPSVQAFGQEMGISKISGVLNRTLNTLNLKAQTANAAGDQILNSDFSLEFAGTKSPLKASVQLLSFPYPYQNPLAAISGSVNVAGDPISQSFTVTGSALADPLIDLGVGQLALTATTSRQILTIAGRDKTGAVKGSVAIPLGSTPGITNRISTQLDLTSFRPDSLKLTPYCIELTSGIEYSFPVTDIYAGDGKMSASSAKVGCKPVTKIRTLRTGTIKAGSLRDASFGVMALGSKAIVEGGFSLLNGFDATVRGGIDGEALAVLVAGADDVRGKISLDAKISGAPSAPDVRGVVRLHEGGLVFANAGLDITNLTGAMDLDGDSLNFSGLTGDLNGGSLVLEGDVLFQDLKASYLRARIDNAILQPSPESTVELDADLLLGLNARSQPQIKGDVQIEAADFAQTITLRTLLQDMLRFFIGGRGIVGKKAVSTENAPIALDLQVRAPNNLNVYTNWAQVELRGELRVNGTMDAPLVTGNVEALSGWFGLRNRRFDITSANLGFGRGTTIPTIELTSEATLRSRQGETVAVFMDINGLISSPKVSLSSDRGYSEQELLLMLAGSGGGVSEGPMSLGVGLEYLDVSLGRKDTTVLLENVVYNLTRIDSVLLEPTFNPATGSLDPAVYAEKRLSDTLVLNATRVFSDTFAQSDLILRWKMTPKLSLDGGFRALVGQDVAGAEGNIKYSIIAPEEQQLVLEVRGNWSVSLKEIEDDLRINSSTRLYSLELPAKERALRRMYRSRGFFDVEAKAYCKREDEGRCKHARFQVTEGKRFRIGKVVNTSGLPAGIQAKDIIGSNLVSEFATKERRERFEKKVLRNLREKGYLGARVNSTYKVDSPQESSNGANLEDGTVSLVVSVNGGLATDFIFEGNSKFTNSELLATLQLADRPQPYGNNVARVLVSNIEVKYRDQGYTQVEVRSEDTSEEGSLRRTYKISITEGEQKKVRKVRIEGVESIGSSAVLKHLKELHGIKDLDPFMKPDMATDDLMYSFSALLMATLADLGYGAAVVTPALEPSGSGLVDVVYQVILGELTVVRSVNLVGMPLLADLVPEPTKPYSVLRLNRYVDRIAAQLADNGFINASVAVAVDDKSQQAFINIEPGERAIIKVVRFEGQKIVKTEVISSTFGIQEGSPWSENDIRQAKRRLYRLGLFARIKTGPEDGALDSAREVLVVQVEERALQSLSVGVGANSELGAHIFTEGTERSLFADGRSLSLKTDIYYDPRFSEVSRGTSSLIFSTPRVLGSDYNWVEDLGYQRLASFNQPYDLARVSLISYLNSDSERDISYFWGHSFFMDELTNVKPDAILSPLDEGLVNISALMGRVLFDYRDNPLDPRSGFAVTTEAKLSSTQIGSAANFATVDTKASLVVPGGGGLERFSLGFTSRVGVSESWGGTEEVPITQRFYLGGRRTVRGFRENSLGPRGAEGAVIGGDLVQYNSGELRYLVGEKVSTHVFLDSGNVFLQSINTDLTDQRVSTGFGAQYLSPIGPVGADIGFPLEEQGGEPSVRFHFSIGSRF